jgi:hypothetical protein
MSFSTYRYGEARVVAELVANLCKAAETQREALLCAALANAHARIHVLEQRLDRLERPSDVLR